VIWSIGILFAIAQLCHVFHGRHMRLRIFYMLSYMEYLHRYWRVWSR